MNTPSFFMPIPKLCFTVANPMGYGVLTNRVTDYNQMGSIQSV